MGVRYFLLLQNINNFSNHLKSTHLMKNDQYFPHYVNTRNDVRIMKLIDGEGATGYAMYWAILEYLRTQDHYIGWTTAIKNIGRFIRVRNDKALRVLNDYGLFVVEGDSFYSVDLIKSMQPLERKRAQREKGVKSSKKEENTSGDDDYMSEFEAILSGIPYNSLKSSKSLSKENKNKEKIDISSSASSEDISSIKVNYKADDNNGDGGGETVAANYSDTLSWKGYIDAAARDQKWLELIKAPCMLDSYWMANFHKVKELFKMHVMVLGKEGEVLSTNDAKRYFRFFLKPGGHTRRWVEEQLSLPEEKSVLSLLKKKRI